MGGRVSGGGRECKWGRVRGRVCGVAGWVVGRKGKWGEVGSEEG